MAVELATAYISLVPSFSGGRGAIEREASKMGDAVASSMAGSIETSSKRGSLSKAFSTVTKGFALLAGANLAADMFGGFLAEAEEAAKVGRLTNAVLESTGSVAGVTAKDVDRLADALSRKSGIDDDVIASGQNVLLTFTKVANQAGRGNDVFDQATALALDMSSALGTDLQGSITQVGKALNDPIQGVGALTRVGVQFTAQQKDQIAALVESGDTLGAQKIILAELSTQFGGAAEAGATASDRMGVAWGQVQETIGTALLPVFESVTTWLAAELPGAIDTAMRVIGEIKEFWQKYADDVGRVLVDIGTVTANIFKGIVDVVTTTVEIVRGVIEAGIAAWKKAWVPIEFLLNLWMAVHRPLIEAVKLLARSVDDIIRAAVTAVRTTWSAIEAIYTFFRDKVYAPLASTAGALRDTVVGAIRGAVDTAKTVWSGLTAIVTFFDTYVASPLRRAVDTLKLAIGNAFDLAVSAVGTAWNKLKGIVKEPINAVIGFYNNGIRWVWNNVISKIPGIGNLAEVARLNKGGWVPGSGDRDTVPAMLTPGEFVVTKDAAKRLGPGVLAALNKGGTLDPGIFGYAQGGYVRSADEALEWARKQEGKPYRFPDVGPDTYDCSGFTSALINYILGLPPHRRRHSSGSIGSDPAVKPGVGDNPLGLLLGAKAPYTTNAQGATIGHIAATLAGVNMEATPPRVRLGQSARGAGHGMFTGQWHLPGYGGLSDSDKGIVEMVKSLVGMKAPEGGSPWESIFPKLVNQLPGKVFDFFMSKLPSLIVDAVKDAVKGVVGAIVPGGDNVFDDIRRRAAGYADGGFVRQTGPILVGERGPELYYGNRGDFVVPNHELGRAGSPSVVINHHGETVTPETVARGLRLARVS